MTLTINIAILSKKEHYMCIHNAEYGTDLKLDTDLAMFLFATKAMMCLT